MADACVGGLWSLWSLRRVCSLRVQMGSGFAFVRKARTFARTGGEVACGTVDLCRERVQRVAGLCRAVSGTLTARSWPRSWPRSRAHPKHSPYQPRPWSKFFLLASDPSVGPSATVAFYTRPALCVPVTARFLRHSLNHTPTPPDLPLPSNIISLSRRASDCDATPC
jgi:hypothetical protein